MPKTRNCEHFLYRHIILQHSCNFKYFKNKTKVYRILVLLPLLLLHTHSLSQSSFTIQYLSSAMEFCCYVFVALYIHFRDSQSCGFNFVANERSKWHETSQVLKVNKRSQPRQNRVTICSSLNAGLSAGPRLKKLRLQWVTVSVA